MTSAWRKREERRKSGFRIMRVGDGSAHRRLARPRLLLRLVPPALADYACFVPCAPTSVSNSLRSNPQRRVESHAAREYCGIIAIPLL
ncbi:hypothetical protein OH77DRAFT_762468 [Trametes cingulata]|nr:hypothetical protein OH77DRAFT_762468 [Trametes cingulata]